MKRTESYIKLVEVYVEQILSELPTQLSYHNFRHTLEVVEAAKILGKGNQLSTVDLEIVIIAAWFHDSGHLKCYFGHEQASKEIAETYLRSIHYPSKRLTKVLDCIEATKFPPEPKTLLEKVICDADMYHLAQNDYLSKCFALKEEIEYIIEKKIPDEDWCICNMEFLSKHQYYTTFAKHQLESEKIDNVKTFASKYLK